MARREILICDGCDRPILEAEPRTLQCDIGFVDEEKSILTVTTDLCADCQERLQLMTKPWLWPRSRRFNQLCNTMMEREETDERGTSGAHA